MGKSLRDGKPNVFSQQGPKDYGTTAPQLRDGAKASYRAAEHGRDAAMHGYRPAGQTSDGRRPTPGPGDGRMAQTATRFPAGVGVNPGVRHPEERGTMANGDNPRPTKSMSASAASGERRSGMERALGALADKSHPTKRR